MALLEIYPDGAERDQNLLLLSIDISQWLVVQN